MEATQHLQPRLMMGLSSLYKSRPHHHIIPKLHRRFYAHIPCPTTKIVMAIATARPATITVRMTAPVITMSPTTGQAVFLPMRSMRADGNHVDTIIIDYPIAMNPRPVLILQTTIHTPATSCPTASGPQTDLSQITLFLATPIRT